jgi:hypothetical protein
MLTDFFWLTLLLNGKTRRQKSFPKIIEQYLLVTCTSIWVFNEKDSLL